ncbi:MAG TPA: hypothetical protein VKB80_15280 [Kofleriaceae bacterium]|nr:hypothetical protein [Kofleriaceae bacterium]
MKAAPRASVIVLVAAAPGCKVDPLYCDESHHCSDPALSFCDLNGEYPASEGVPRTCIADPRADGGPDAETSFSIAVASERLYVRQGESAQVDVTVTRDGDFDETVTVALEGLPAGVAADPITLGSDETTGRLIISAEDDSSQGAVDLDVSGTAGDVVRTPVSPSSTKRSACWWPAACLPTCPLWRGFARMGPSTPLLAIPVWARSTSESRVRARRRPMGSASTRMVES